VFASEDAREGPRAFAEKRRPQSRDRKGISASGLAWTTLAAGVGSPVADR